MRSVISASFALIAVSAFFFACTFAVQPAFAKDTQADMQCPPGGTVGQPCKDNTNGYTTSGHCTHINVCKADSWNSNPPKGCGSSGNIYAPTADCPKGPKIGQGTPTQVSPTPTTTQYIPSKNGTAITTDIFAQAFSDTDTSATDQKSTGAVSTTSLNGIEYFISGGEALAAGSPLTEEEPALIPPDRSTLALGSVAGLQPRKLTIESTNSSYDRSYAAPIGSFSSAGSQTYQRQADIASKLVALGTDAVQNFSDGLVHVLMNASGLNFDTATEVVTIRPYESMYDQADHADLAPFIEPPWQKVSQAPLAYQFAERMTNVGRLFHESLASAGAASYDLFTADLRKSKDEFGSAFEKASDAFGLMGNLAASLALKALMQN